MSITDALHDIMDNKRQKANVKMVGNVAKASMFRSFAISIPNTQPPFDYAFIYTNAGIEECDPITIKPTVKATCTFEVFSSILSKKLTFQDAIYSGLVQLYGDEVQLHTQILLAFFGDVA